MSQPPNTKAPAIRLDDAGVEPLRRKDGQLDRRASGLRQPPKRRPTTNEHADDPRWRPDLSPNGRPWKRFRGRGRRGRAKGAAARDDDLDLRFAIDELTAARIALRRAHAMPVPDPGDLEARAARADALRSAIAKVALAGRLIDAVVLRRGGKPSDLLGISDEER